MRRVRKAPEPPYSEPETPAWPAIREHLFQLPRRQQVLLAAHAARSVLHVFEEEFPDDDRPRQAIEAAEAWAHDPSPANRWAAAMAASACRHAYTAAPYFAYSAAFAAFAAAQTASQTASHPDDDYSAIHAISFSGSATRDSGPAHRSSTWRSLYHARAPEGASFSLDWRTPEVVNLARSIHDHYDWQGLPVLADALEEAGCTDQKILAPLRHGRDHSRASWALQQILYGGQG